MQILDSHVHMALLGRKYNGTDEEMRAAFLADLAKAGIGGAQVMSPDPRFGYCDSIDERIERVIRFCKGQDNLYPFYWLNPLADTFLEEIDRAVEAGVDGFKMILSECYPDDEQVMAACRHIAEKNKPVLFHTGISWDGVPSANYFRPGNYECLMEVPHLRFALAHVSWPWSDECIAVYSKINHAMTFRKDVTCEMFIDTTPGTPAVYRREAFERLFTSGFQVKYNVIFGTDGSVEEYNVDWAKQWIERDTALIREFVPEDADDVIDHVFQKNFLRFMGKIEEDIDREYPGVGE